jgi:hypothetical protein
MRLKVLGKLKKFIHLIGSRTRDLPTCSIVPQPITLQRVPACYGTEVFNCVLTRSRYIDTTRTQAFACDVF